jgi:hypothetical protein
MTATKVEFASGDYFTLLAARPELAAPFALGPRVIAFASDGAAYEVTDVSAPPLTVPPTYTPEPNATEIANVNATQLPAATPAPAITPAPPTTPRSGSLCAGAFLAPMLIAVPFLLRRRKRT